MMIEILYDHPWEDLPSEETMREAIIATLPNGQGDVCVRLADDNSVQQLNNKWRQIDAVTDVLSFSMQEGEAIDFKQPLGDIIVAIPFIQQEAIRLAITVHNHLIHLLIHGTLHLLGFDHAKADECNTMRNHERRIMQRLQLPDPWPN